MTVNAGMVIAVNEMETELKEISYQVTIQMTDKPSLKLGLCIIRQVDK